MPRELRYILVCVAITVAAWAYLLPAFQAPDENAHFSRVARMAETGGTPGAGMSSYRSTEQDAAARAVNSDQIPGQLGTEPVRDRHSYDQWRAEHFTPAQRDDAAGINPADGNPPGYYLLAVPVYKLAGGLDLFSRLIFVRLLGVLFACALAILGWMLAAALMPRSRPAHIVAAAVCGLLPMIDFLAGSVSVDGAQYVAWALALVAGVKALRGSLRWTIVLVLATIAAIVIKYPSVSLLPGVAFVIGLSYLRYGRWPAARRSRGWALAGGLGLAALAIVAVIASGHAGAQVDSIGHTPGDKGLLDTGREFVSYVWQFYLPRLPSMTRFDFLAPGHPLWDTWITGYWGRFGWLEVRLPLGIYVTLVVVTVVALAAGLSVVWERLGAIAEHRTEITYLLIVTITLIVGLHWTDYKTIEGKGLFLQARYLLPLNPLFALVAGAAVGPRLVRWPRMQSSAVGGVLGLLAALNVLSLGIVLFRFYG